MDISEYIKRELAKPLLDKEKKPVTDQDGKPLTKEEAIAVNLVNEALRGDINAIRYVQAESRKNTLNIQTSKDLCL